MVNTAQMNTGHNRTSTLNKESHIKTDRFSPFHSFLSPPAAVWQIQYSLSLLPSRTPSFIGASVSLHFSSLWAADENQMGSWNRQEARARGAQLRAWAENRAWHCQSINSSANLCHVCLMNDPTLHHSWVGTGAWGETYKRPERGWGPSNPECTCAAQPL